MESISSASESSLRFRSQCRKGSVPSRISMLPERTLLIGSSFNSANLRCLVADWKLQVWESKTSKQTWEDDSGTGSDVSDWVMRVRLKSDLGSVVGSHLLSDSGVHGRIPAGSLSFSFLPAAPPHRPDAQECVGGVKRVPIDGWSGEIDRLGSPSVLALFSSEIWTFNADCKKYGESP